MEDGRYKIYHMQMRNGRLEPTEEVGSFDIMNGHVTDHDIESIDGVVTIHKIQRLYGNSPYYSIIKY